jgi:glycosyltransferase involved in cell wall biosynthesis
VAVSEFMLEQMRQHPHARLTRRIYNGIGRDMSLEDAAPESPREGGEVVVGAAGRLVAGKGIEYLIGTVERIADRVPVRLLIAGDGPEKSRLTREAHTRGIADRVEFVGQVADMRSFWRRCDVAAVPSDRMESFSMVTLEAMGAARAVVASRQGAIPELILDGITGTLVPPGDTDALAAAVLRYAEDEELRRAHGCAARTRAIECFNLETCARAYLDLFAELIERRDSGRRR